MQNHLMQILSLIAMEKPKSIDLNEIKNEKVKLLQAINEIQMEDIVLGQYERNMNGTEDEILGYLDDPTVRKGFKHKQSAGLTS